MNKVCIITNAGNALGGAYAREMAKNGYSVALIDINEEMTLQIADNICTVGGLAKAYTADPTSYSSLVNAYSIIKKEFGNCNILINLPCMKKEFNSTDYDEDVLSCYDFITRLGSVDTTTQSTLLASRVFMAEEKPPYPRSIVNISNNIFDFRHKCGKSINDISSKLTETTQELALYFSRQNVRVNAILLGCILSDDNESSLKDESGALNQNAKDLSSMIPMSRLGTVDDVCGVLSFLADNSLSGFVTGEILHVDGGYGLYDQNS